jgi:hypothetical protein
MYFSVTLFIKYGYQQPLINREVFIINCISETLEEINLIGIKEAAIAMLLDNAEHIPLFYEVDEINISRS